MRVLACGDVSLLLEVDGGVDEVVALAAAVRDAAFDGVLDVVPAARTVLLTTIPGTDLGALRRAVLAMPVDPVAPGPEGAAVELAARRRAGGS